MSPINPYANVDFFQFLTTLGWRILLFISGRLSLDDLAADEIQVLTLICVSTSCAIVGTFLVLKKITMLANSISHTILLGIVIAYVITGNSVAREFDGSIDLKTTLLAALVTGMATTFITQLLKDLFKLQEDAGIALVFTSFFALGVTLLTMLTRSAHIGTEIIFGDVDSLQQSDILLALIILSINLILSLSLFKEHKIVAFDPHLANTLGISPAFFNYLLMVQVAATAIGAFRAVGVILVLAFMTGPVLTARLLTDDLRKLIFLAILFGQAASLIAVVLSRHLLSQYDLALSTGGITVVVIFIIFLIVYAHRKFKLQKFAKKV